MDRDKKKRIFNLEDHEYPLRFTAFFDALGFQPI
jgi:hypothetical protein